MDPKDWIREFARELDLEVPDDRQIDELLDLAGIAAHASQRTAAPIACYLAGLSGLPASELIERAGKVAG